MRQEHQQESNFGHVFGHVDSKLTGADMEFCLGETINKADLVDRIVGACSMSKTQAALAIDTAVDSAGAVN